MLFHYSVSKTKLAKLRQANMASVSYFKVFFKRRIEHQYRQRSYLAALVSAASVAALRIPRFSHKFQLGFFP